ncbi:tRNA modification GTPase [Anatilimnocola floriformis]|uniref:tRNA modification GTPase n=1 Tax=Anatilimnocola floriformis TaxID=2948575 RepID=UPI0020C30C1E|nr:tRNA modification GTPase [Anatilimnocola floriformis]
MSLAIDDTIVALASAAGGSYEGIIRVSGPAVVEVLKKIFDGETGSGDLQSKRPLVLNGRLRLASDTRAQEVHLPALVYLWPTSRSYTRQPLAEIYLPGSPPLLDLAIRSLCKCGARLAGPGEFTLRAFLAGRLDLTQAEAVLGVIDAQDAASLQSALTQLSGGLSHPLASLRNQLLDLLAHLEAGLDFVDEDIEFISRAELQQQVTAAATKVQSIADQLNSRSETSTSAPRVVLYGEPNAGKSSLLNALAGTAAAIVSPVAGTTRDYLVRLVTIDNQQLQLIDTAGVEEVSSTNAIAADAQSLGQSQHQQADLQLLCIDSSQPMSPWSHAELQRNSLTPRLIIGTKFDQTGGHSFDLPSPALLTSVVTGHGLDELRGAIITALRKSTGEIPVVATTALRCTASLQAAATALASAADLTTNGASDEWIAAELRLALDELGQVIGAVYTDDILDRVFSRFCIGK